MLRFDIITLFPEVFEKYFSVSILKRAQEKKLIKINTVQLRNYASGRHKVVDDKPYGGGAGMIIKAEPVLRAISALKCKTQNSKCKIILLSAKGKQFNQKTAADWAKKYNRLILISGRYEGIDERVKKILKAEEISIGPYILTDGDLPAMIVVSAVARLLPGVIKEESLREESFIQGTACSVQRTEYPQYTRPEVITYGGKKYKVPPVLLKGDHKKIEQWRKSKQK